MRAQDRLGASGSSSRPLASTGLAQPSSCDSLAARARDNRLCLAARVPSLVLPWAGASQAPPHGLWLFTLYLAASQRPLEPSLGQALDRAARDVRECLVSPEDRVANVPVSKITALLPFSCFFLFPALIGHSQSLEQTVVRGKHLVSLNGNL